MFKNLKSRLHYVFLRPQVFVKPVRKDVDNEWLVLNHHAIGGFKDDLRRYNIFVALYNLVWLTRSNWNASRDMAFA